MESQKEKMFIQQFKLKRTIKKLEKCQGAGTALISMIIPANKKISDYTNMIVEEIGKADNIKDRVNRQAVVMALTSVKEKLRGYHKSPKNGLAIYCGNAYLPGNKTERKIMIVVEPHKELLSKLYKCSDVFETEPLKVLLESNERYGFIIVDGNGALFGFLQGNAKKVAKKFSVQLPKKHGRGGQSQNRFANIREEKRLIYTKKVCEEATKVFIENNLPNVNGIVLGGYADFKNNVRDNAVFDQRLRKIVLKTVDIAYGMEQGFNQAIELSQDCFANVRMVQEQKTLNTFYENINFDTGKIVYGIKETMKMYFEGCIKRMIIYDQLEYNHVELKPIKSQDGNEVIVEYLLTKDVEYKNTWTNPKTKVEYAIQNTELLIDWLGDNYTEYGVDLYFVTDRSPEGNQFVKGFSGIGALLKYKVEIVDNYDYDDESDSDSEDDFI